MAAGAAEKALRDAKVREASDTATAAVTEKADRSLARILRRLNSALDKPGSRKETRRLKMLRSAVKAERERLAG